jgi:hypothetical protein
MYVWAAHMLNDENQKAENRCTDGQSPLEFRPIEYVSAQTVPGSGNKAAPATANPRTLAVYWWTLLHFLSILKDYRAGVRLEFYSMP